MYLGISSTAVWSAGAVLSSTLSVVHVVTMRTQISYFSLYCHCIKPYQPDTHRGIMFPKEV